MVIIDLFSWIQSHKTTDTIFTEKKGAVKPIKKGMKESWNKKERKKENNNN